MKTRFAIAIVGLGPRSLSVLDQLDRRFTEALARDVALEITVLDPYPPGGRVWDPAQPVELLMNTLASETTAFAPGDASDRYPTLYAWTRLPGVTDSVAEHLRHFAEELDPEGYAPRALFGTYLQWAYGEIERRLAGRVRLVHLRERVLSAVDTGKRVVLTTNRATVVTTNMLIVAPGHLPVISSSDEQQLTRAATTFNGVFAPASHPLDTPVASILERENVLVRGLALNFFDILAMLTEGRGGRFTSAGGTLRYIPSGREPRIYAGSGRGTPPLARVDSPSITDAPVFLTDVRVRELSQMGSHCDFRRDVWPEIVRETSWAYYSALARLQPDAVVGSLPELAEVLRQADPFTPELTSALASLVPTASLRIDLRRLGNALEGRTFHTRDQLDDFMVAHLDADVESARHPEWSARAHCQAALRSARVRLHPLLAAGGIGGESYLRDVEGWFAPLMRTISNGPPVMRIAQLAALVRSGVVSFIGGGTRVSADSESFIAQSETVLAPVRARVLLDCFVPRQDARNTVDPLIRSLFARGTARSHRRPNSRGEGTELGAIDVDPNSGGVLSRSGDLNPRILISGVPLEGVRWNTALAGRAGEEGDFFRDTRILAEQVIRMAASSRLLVAEDA